MKTLLTYLSTLFLAAALLAPTGCGDDDFRPDPTTSGTGDTTTGDGDGDTTTGDGDGDGDETPAIPALGAQIDRVGRPAITTATIATFESDDTAKGTAKNDYNRNDDPTTWATYSDAIGGSIAIYDGADGTCGNQIVYNPTDVAEPTNAEAYGTLAGVLAADYLVIDTSASACTGEYLAVEATAAVADVSIDDCGGRKPASDVIDRSYSVLAAGDLSGVTDGIPSNDVDFLTEFPFLAAPNSDE